ncbi:MAG: ABC transporter ATP-binding protein [Thermodesulfobacteriota bacterium]
MADSPVVEFEDVSFSYDGYPVLEEATFSVRHGEFVSIVGPNGGGKTTLVKLMLGLLRPSQGRVRLFGGPPEENRSRTGYLPQHARLDPQFPATVMDVALMGRLGNSGFFGKYSRQDKQAALASLEQVGLKDLKSRRFSDLSGGQRQRLLIARALASDPELLIMDEPTAHLDRAVEGEFHELLREFNKRMTIVVVSHDLGFVSEFVEKVVCVKVRVMMHSTSDITGQIINDMYGSPRKLVRHNSGGETKAIHQCFSS